ncbi:hypothetical protein BJX96DRAFT_144260 [Aspergillus floccosus]
MQVPFTKGRPNTVQSRNIAIFSVAAVIAGGWLAFRARSPKQEDQVGGRRGEAAVVSEQDVQTMRGGKPGEGKPGRGPSPYLGHCKLDNMRLNLHVTV